MAAAALCVIGWSGQVQIGVGFVMPLNKWHYIFKSASDGKCPLEVAWHLWTPVQAGESSLTGQACRTMCRASWKLLATPEKVAALKNCLAKYISDHPMMPPAPHPENHLASQRKHLWSSLLHKQDARASEWKSPKISLEIIQIGFKNCRYPMNSIAMSTLFGLPRMPGTMR
ncbi:uncharacterized protein LOC142583692 [Dermacentor variabilis]|uniref:uncharacterized protein LOC142583692 n=1 Tax=Dermacentor variabilis TaxID=34621 RepID=UPI003F5B9CF6